MIEQQLLEQLRSVKQDMDIPDGFICLGLIDTVYPTLPDDLLTNWYRIWIWENREGIRIATWDKGNSWCHFMCEGTEEAILANYKKQNGM
ncbi:hypothetical protein COK00_12030 [Bacillus cereus]|uniref:hypothetical protein n=1 Tax=Bacillus cereus TaxID=1396 RepID=UPI000BF75716|nr:hypothetical protein [Bacillus cereus]PFP65321.1 hypothetical protein COK00_12030 [Bacillus cereus]